MRQRSILVFAVITALLSCTHQIRPVSTLEQPPAVERLPIVIGVYESQAFKQYSASRGFDNSSSYNLETFNFEIGPPSAELLDSLLKGMFERVVTFDDMTVVPKEIDAILEPTIEEFSWPTQSMMVDKAEVIYLFKFYDVDKHFIGNFRVTGKGNSGHHSAWYISHIQDAAEFAIKDALAQFVIAFQGQPEIKQWLAEKMGSIKK
jgi:hypothetical protein